MKNVSKLFVLAAIIAIVVVACSSEQIGEYKVDGRRITSPGWLEYVVDSVAHTYRPSPATGEYPYPEVCLVTYKGKTYIQVWNLLESCATCGNLIYDEYGNQILPDSELYQNISESKDKKKLVGILSE